jgi:membrane fusion protein (multidrug efflux system)
VVALDRARARQDKVRTDIEALQAAYRSKQAELILSQTNAVFAEKEYRRQADLSQQHFTSQIQLDSLHHSLDVARQQLAVLQQDIERVLAGLNHEPDAPVEKYPAYQEVAAELAQASINLDHATVYAPFDGVVSNVPKLGQHLNAGSPALTLVASRAPWIEANFNETDLTHVLPGQTAEIRVDMYPDLRLSGKVASISPASGAEFSILPAQNASGNWVKVVQRITVRIELDNQDTTPVLRPGMSTQINIDTGSNRFQRIGQ